MHRATAAVFRPPDQSHNRVPIAGGDGLIEQGFDEFGGIAGLAVDLAGQAKGVRADHGEDLAVATGRDEGQPRL
jgi:hypothetical protein